MKSLRLSVLRSAPMLILAAMVLTGFASQARADDDDHRGNQRDRHYQEQRRDGAQRWEHRDRYDYNQRRQGYYYTAPPPAVYYAPPQPPPGINLVFPFSFR